MANLGKNGTGSGAEDAHPGRFGQGGPAPRLLILDFDGTLADSGPWLAGVLNQVAARHGFRRMSGTEMAELRGLHARAVMRRLGIPPWRVPAIARDVRARMAREIGAVPLFPGIPAALHRLHGAGWTLAVASSNTETNVRAVLGPHAAAISLWACGTSLFGKAARFRRVLRRAGVAADRALCVGDELRDAEAAGQAGIAFAAVLWGYNTPEVLRAANPVAAFATPAALADRLA